MGRNNLQATAHDDGIQGDKSQKGFGVTVL
jgi:hypothetical protein